MVRAHSGELYQFAVWRCRDRFVAEDVVQETFARAWKAWQTLNDERAVRAWLYTILRHEIARMYERKQLDFDPDQEVEDLPCDLQSESHDALEMREALHALPTTYREALMLQVLGGFSCAEIAQILSITDAAAMTRLSRARVVLRKLVQPNGRRLEKAT